MIMVSREAALDFSPGFTALLPSREAALDISPGRKPWVEFGRSASPGRATDNSAAPSGLAHHRDIDPGLRRCE